MTKLTKTELAEMGQVLILANTPASLMKGLRNSFGMQKLMFGWSLSELLQQYDKLTARPKQTEIGVALSYALLISMVLRGEIGVDPSRLRWGEYLREYLSRSNANNEYLKIELPTAGPTIRATNTSSSNVLFGPDDRPIDQAERLR